MSKYLLVVLLGIISATCYAQDCTVSYWEMDTLAKVKPVDSLKKVDSLVHVAMPKTAYLDTVRYGVRGNLFSYLTLNPHLDFDIFCCKRWNFAVGGAYGWWGFNGDQHAIQTWRVTTEARFYFKRYKFTGHSLGIRAETGQIDALVKKYGYRGHLSTCGLTYSYTWRLGKNNRWYMDAGLGAGYVYAHYVKYIPYFPTECYHKIHVRTRHEFTLTNAFINLGYRFPAKGRKGGIK